MSIRKILQDNVWDEELQQWVTAIPATHAKAVETAGGNLQDDLDAIPVAISEAIAGVQGGAPEEANTLGKLYSTMETVKTLLTADDPSLDTLQEIVDFVKVHGDDLDKIGTNKVGYTDIVNALDTVSTVEGKALDARQGKVLSDAVNTIKSSLDGLAERSEGFVTQGAAATMIEAQRPVISDQPPANPVDGQVWLKPVRSIEV